MGEMEEKTSATDIEENEKIESEELDEEQDASQAQGINWQPMLERIKWEDLNELIHVWGHRGSKERMSNVIGVYAITALTIITAGLLAYQGIIEGQAITGFLGAVIGYLLSSSRAE